MRDPAAALVYIVLTSIALQSAAQQPPSRREPKRAYIIRGALALKAGELLKAQTIANDCVAHYPKERKCHEIVDSARSQLRAQWVSHLKSLPAQDLPKIENALEQLTLYDGSVDTRQALENARKQRQEIRLAADAYVQRLHDRAVGEPFPEELHPYVRYLPELAAAEKESVIHAALDNSREAEKRGAHNLALIALTAFTDHPEIAARLKEVQTAAAEALAASVKETLGDGSLENVASAFAVFTEGAAALSPERQQQQLAQLQDASVSAVKPLVPAIDDPESGGAVARSLRDKLPGSLAEHFPWERVTKAAPGLRATLNVPQLGSDCAGVTADRIRRATESALPSSIQATESSRVTIELQDVACAVETKVVAEEPVNSTYVASYQQVTNPAYVQLQQRLNQAQQTLAQVRQHNALNPPQNGWQGAAQAIAETTAVSRVNNLLSELEETPPFHSQPIILAYSPYRYLAARTAGITATLTVSDIVTGYADAVSVSGSAESKAEGVRGVLERDQSGLHNREPQLNAADTLLTDAFTDLLSHGRPAIQRFAGNASMQRALDAGRKKAAPALVLGYLRLAQDLEIEPSDVKPFELTLKRFADTPISQLASFRMDYQAFGPGAAPGRRIGTTAKSRPTSTPRSPRAGMLNAVLDSIVTISAGEGTGSGFFVGSGGQLITNAHVVQGASKIIVRTRAKESFLARVVKLSPNDDLALLAVPGLEVDGLRLGDSDAADVGTDVIAVGSPLGLEGTVTRGIISGIRRFGGVPYLQIDAAINPGNSGGPLISETGEVVGINTWKVPAKITDSIGFAISINHARKIFGPLLSDRGAK